MCGGVGNSPARDRPAEGRPGKGVSKGETVERVSPLERGDNRPVRPWPRSREAHTFCRSVPALSHRSASLTAWLTVLPSARPATFGITIFMTTPIA